ncbi:MAG TPA: hypothetical protein VFA89_15535 [Terriglobales bacterium]|nr:hypothetical protein [Terriglobales bacterium]
MDYFHREIITDTRTAKPCAFCQHQDPEFHNRRLMDQVVQDSDTASGHVTEDGHVRHRILELLKKMPVAQKHVHPAA